MSAAAAAAGYLAASDRAVEALERMQRAMDDIAAGPQRQAARREAERAAADLKRDRETNVQQGAVRPRR